MFQITLNELGIPLFFSLPNILANRLLISMRSPYQTSFGADTVTDWDMPTIRFRPPTTVNLEVRDIVVLPPDS
jgi:hypothetical protein